MGVRRQIEAMSTEIKTAKTLLRRSTVLQRSIVPPRKWD